MSLYYLSNKKWDSWVNNWFIFFFVVILLLPLTKINFMKKIISVLTLIIIGSVERTKSSRWQHQVVPIHTFCPMREGIGIIATRWHHLQVIPLSLSHWNIIYMYVSRIYGIGPFLTLPVPDYRLKYWKRFSLHVMLA